MSSWFVEYVLWRSFPQKQSIRASVLAGFGGCVCEIDVGARRRLSRVSNNNGKKAAAIALISALDNGNDAVASTFWLNEGKVPALSNEPLEFASNFSASIEAKFTAAAVATTLMMIQKNFFMVSMSIINTILLSCNRFASEKRSVSAALGRYRSIQRVLRKSLRIFAKAPRARNPQRCAFGLSYSTIQPNRKSCRIDYSGELAAKRIGMRRKRFSSFSTFS